MIQLIEGLPDAVVGLEAIGEVESADYEAIAAPAVKRALERHAKIRLIHVLNDRFSGYTVGGAYPYGAHHGFTHRLSSATAVTLRFQRHGHGSRVSILSC